MGEAEQCYEDPRKLERGPDGVPKNWPFSPERLGFRLPTEAEWECACRGGTSTPFGFGSDRELLAEYGWFLGSAARRTHLGGELRPNLRGLFDMHGNLAEWCHDSYDSYPREGVTDPTGPSQQAPSRVFRGGSWSTDPIVCRSACRSLDPPATGSAGIGFRLVRGVTAGTR